MQCDAEADFKRIVEDAVERCSPGRAEATPSPGVQQPRQADFAPLSTSSPPEQVGIAIPTKAEPSSDAVTEPAGSVKAPPEGVTPPMTYVALAPMTSTFVHSVQVPVACLPSFLNELGTKLVEAGFPDVQVWLQRRESKGTDVVTEVWGLVIDVDAPTKDIPLEVRDAGVPMPTAYWQTRHGYKLGYAFAEPIDHQTAARLAAWLAMAFRGGDPCSWNLAHGQHLPTCIKSTPDGQVVVSFPAHQGNSQPAALDQPMLAALPSRLAAAWGSVETTGPIECDRSTIEAYLEEIGTPAPEHPGSSNAYSVCPESEVHYSPCCYVRRAEDGHLNVVCFGSHGGTGPKKWSEPDLQALATGSPGGAGGIDAVRDLPATWAGVDYRAFRLRQVLDGERFLAEHVRAAELLWRIARAFHDLEHWRRQAETVADEEGAEEIRPPTVDMFLQLYESRLRPHHGLPPARLAYDSGTMSLVWYDPVGTLRRLLVRGETLSEKTHLHEWFSTPANNMLCAVKKVEED